ncbi:zinc finger protein 90-like [Cydia splendana]|uniref:zinc finger protein 90-like n=1 Tax=Cydia splendana TaxID=1100963 RepID=UPI00300CA573
MESTLQDTEEVFVKGEPPEDCGQDEPSCDVFIKIEPCVKDEPMCERVSFEMKLEDVCVKQEPSETDGTATAGLYAGHLENNELVLQPVRGPEPAVKRRVATQGQSPKKKSSVLHDVKRYKCDQCSFIACTNEADLLIHKKIHTIKKKGVLKRTDTKKKAYKCSYCSEAFSEEVSLQAHKRKHTGEKSFKCDQCGYTSTQERYLLSHKASHINVRPYKCSQCDFACAKKDELINHKVIIHSYEPPFKCEVCSFAAESNKTLQLHKATHTGAETYKCSTCNYTTLRRDNLTQHEARHAAKRFKCDKCSFGCNQEYRLKNHERTHTYKT